MPIRGAIIGVGNAASILAQGLTHYRRAGGNAGLWHAEVGGFDVKDVEIVAAFDIDARKVGLDLSDAIFAQPNVAKRHIKMAKTGIKVKPGLEMNDVAPNLAGQELTKATPEELTKELRRSGAEIVVNLISSGTDHSATAYARAALEAGCSFVNCTPSLLLKDRSLLGKFTRKGLIIVGDDLMSQFGGTVFHKGLLNLMVKRGVAISKSYQLDVGGGSETFNTIDEEIKAAKRKVKTTSVASEVPYHFETVAGTTDFVDYMGNERTSYFWVEGSGFLGTDVGVDVYLRTSDGANAGNVLLDVVRAVAAASESKRSGAVQEICGYGFKSPPKPVHFEEAYSAFAKSFLG